MLRSHKHAALYTPNPPSLHTQIYKIFPVQLFNAYAALYYLAFFQPMATDCGLEGIDCVSRAMDVRKYVQTVTIVRFVVMAVVRDAVLAQLCLKKNEAAETAGTDEKPSEFESAYFLKSFDPTTLSVMRYIGAF